MEARGAVSAAAVASVLLFVFAPASSAAPPGSITEFGVPSAEGAPYALAAGPEGNAWFTEVKQDAIGRVTPSGAVTEFPVPTPEAKPTGITTGPDGNVWFTEYARGKIGRITPIGAITEFAIPTPEAGPVRVTSGPDGNLWFVEERANKIGRITPAGALAEFAVPTTMSHPTGIAWGADGNLWFAESNGDRIGRISPSGTIAEFPVPTPEAGPEDIAPGPDGNLWFSEFKADKIGRITPAGVVTEFQVPTEKASPEWITAGPDGDMWFSEPEANMLGRITPGGAITELALPSSGSAPAGITTAADGNVWFAERMKGRVGRIGAGVSEALVSPLMIIGGAQQGSVQSCSAAWWSWASVQPQSSLFGFDGYRWLLDGTPITTGQTYTPTAANIGHELSCSATVTYPLPLLVTAVAASSPVVVSAPPTPFIADARESSKTWREGPALARISRMHRLRRIPIGTTFSFSLNVQASVTFTFSQSRPGRHFGRRCLTPSRRNARRGACTRSFALGRLSFAARAATNTVLFAGRLSASKKLPQGRCTVTIVATNLAGATSKPIALRFTIVR